MADFKSEAARAWYAETYDAVMEDWLGEIDFYLRLAADHLTRKDALLELACGTGRIAIRLAEAGFQVIGLDSSSVMLKVAREKSRGVPHIRWVEGDMRSFNLDQTFPLVIIPAHSFQNLTDPGSQLKALGRIMDHLSDGGILVLHLDHLELDWLRDLALKDGGQYQPDGLFMHPTSKAGVRVLQAWSYNPITQTATSQTTWEILGEDGGAQDRLESGPLEFHCFFYFEVEHLLARAGFEIAGVYGDFYRADLQATSSEMIWVARKPTLRHS
jgi:ubiquinone/menaquinone biosynthesis C-methylase UbiE